MAPASRQQTFELIPNAGPRRVGNDPSAIFSKPPMTTKQARKLHNQKKKGPKLSKAELRRIELLEQDRIRKECEKEKAQARARAARDKKKAKEDQEKEERKRKGLPLKDIHPSQDTISRFLSRAGFGFGKKHELPLDTLDEGDSETATEGDESVTDAGDDEEDAPGKERESQTIVEGGSSPERKAKRIRLVPPENGSAETSPAPPQYQGSPAARIVQEFEEQSYSRTSNTNTDGPMNETLLENQLHAKPEQASSRLLASEGADEEQNLTAIHLPESAVAAPLVLVSSASREPSEASHLPRGPEPPEGKATPVVKARPETGTASRNLPHLGTVAFKKPASPYVHRHPINPPAFRVPNGPPKFKSPIIRSNYAAETPKFLSRHLNSAHQRQSPTVHQTTAQNLPTSTQAFLFDHADDLFPSATQEARELAGDLVLEPANSIAIIPRPSINGPLRGTAGPSRPQPVAPKPGPPEQAIPVAEMSFESSCLSTQDLMMSTQDLLDIDTPSKAPASAARAPNLTNIMIQSPIDAGTAIAQEAPVIDSKNTPDSERQAQVNRKPTNTTAASAVSNAPCSSGSSSRHSQGHKFACPSSHKRLSQQSSKQKIMATEAASRPLRSSYQRHAAMVQQRSTPLPSRNSRPATPGPNLVVITTPKNQPPKKRMFGSSGPGPEGLVAMERSYQEMRREERARMEQLRAQERLVGAARSPAEQLELELSEFVDELLDGDLDMNFGKASFGRHGDSNTTKGIDSGNAQPPQLKASARDRQHVDTGVKTCTVAYQEMDYGDLDDLDLEFLKGDTSWIDEDLDDI